MWGHTWPSGSSGGDEQVDTALTDLADADPDTAEAARAGFESLTWGEGLASVTAHGLAEFLWYQLPLKWMCDLREKQQVAAALGELFTRLGKSRYAATCASPATTGILAAYQHEGETAGLQAYRAALEATGVEPPDIPHLIEWGSVMGTDEATAYWSASIALERAIDTGELTPGARGWRTKAKQITSRFLHGPHDEVTGTTWLQWLHTERLQRWVDSRSPGRGRLADKLVDQLVNPLPAPADAEQHLAPVTWLLDHAATGAPLTQTGNLARAIVAEGCRRFDWLTLTGNPRSESDIVELWTLRGLAKQMGALRRSGRRLLLSTTGKKMHAAGIDEQWQATMACLLGPGDAETAAGEIALMLLLTDHTLDYATMNNTVAQALPEGGWHSQRTGHPITPNHAATLLGELRRRLRLLSLAVEKRLGEPLHLNDTGRRAAHTALRARGLRPRHHPLV